MISDRRLPPRPSSRASFAPVEPQILWELCSSPFCGKDRRTCRVDMPAGDFSLEVNVDHDLPGASHNISCAYMLESAQGKILRQRCWPASEEESAESSLGSGSDSDSDQDWFGGAEWSRTHRHQQESAAGRRTMMNASRELRLGIRRQRSNSWRMGFGHTEARDTGEPGSYVAPPSNCVLMDKFALPHTMTPGVLHIRIASRMQMGVVKVSAKLVSMSHKDNDNDNLDDYNITELTHHMMAVRTNPTPVAKPDAGSPAPCADEENSILASYASTMAQQKQLRLEQRGLYGEGTNPYMHRALVPEPPHCWQEPPVVDNQPRLPYASNSLANRCGQWRTTGQLESPAAISGAAIIRRSFEEDICNDKADGTCVLSLGQTRAEFDSPAPSTQHCTPFLETYSSAVQISVEEAGVPPRLRNQLMDEATSLEKSVRVGVPLPEQDSSETPLQSHPVPRPPVCGPAPPVKTPTESVSGEQDVCLMISNRRPLSGARRIVERNVVKY